MQTKNKFISLSVILLLVMGLISCSIGTKFTKKDTISSFQYDYGSFWGGYWDFSVKVENGAVLFNAKGGNGVDLLVEDKVVPESVLTDLQNILLDSGWTQYNGFNKYDMDVLDGYGFSLNVVYQDEKTLTATGYAKEPKNYDTAHEALSTYLLNLAEES